MRAQPLSVSPSPAAVLASRALAGGLAAPRAAPACFAADQPHQMVFRRAGEEFYAQGERAGALYQVEFGVIRLYRLLADGRRQISAFHLAGEVFGFEADGRHHFFAEAVGDAGVRVFRQPADDGNWRRTFEAALTALVRAQEHLLVIGRQNASERVAAFLLDLMERQGGAGRIELAMSRTDIGDYLGLTIETVSRTLTKFRTKGLVRLQGTRIVEIVEARALRALCA